MVNKTVSDLIADFLIEKKIKTVFGIIGSANAGIFDSIIQKNYTKIVYMHHEQAVVMAAGAYYRASGNVTVAIVTAGGGAANAFTGVLSNWADSIPCIVISGQEKVDFVNNHSQLRMYGTQGFDASSMVRKFSKYTNDILDKNDVYTSLTTAYNICKSNRPGPTWINIPIDIQLSSIDQTKEQLSIIEDDNKSSISEKEINKTIDFIEKAKRPVILIGHGIKLSKSTKLFRKLSKKLKIPVLSSWLGIEVMPSDDPYFFGCPGVYGQRKSNFIIQNCDLLIVIGNRLSIPQTGYNFDNFAPHAKIISINNDKDELKKYSMDLKIEGDCKEFLEKISTRTINTYREDWLNWCQKIENQFPIIESHHLEDNKKFDNSYVTINNISKKLDDDAIIIFGQGTPIASGHQAFNVKKNQSILCSCGLGEMGNGIPSSIGAAFTTNSRQIVSFISDGSMMMNLQELQTIAGYNLPIKIILFNNQGYLFIKHTQKMLFDGRYTGVDNDTGVFLPKYKKICKAFDIPYFNTKTTSIDEFLQTPGPCLYETFMNPEQELSPKVKGIVGNNNEIIAPPLEEMSPVVPLKLIEENMIEINKISYNIKR